MKKLINRFLNWLFDPKDYQHPYVHKGTRPDGPQPTKRVRSKND